MPRMWSKQDLSEILVELAGCGKDWQGQDITGLSGAQATAPDVVAERIENVLSGFETLIAERNHLAEELLSCYNHLNITFETTVAVAACQDMTQAFRELAGKIAQGIEARYFFYRGIKLDLAGKAEESRQWVVDALPVKYRPHSERFFASHREKIISWTSQLDDIDVCMLGYEGTLSADDEGMGNILAQNLKTNKEQLETLGTLVFVRGGDQPPFRSGEMNLASTLGHTGAAVLGNIVYARKIHQVYLQTISSLVRAMEAKDEYTSGHSLRVSEMACALGRELGLDEHQVQLLNWAGQLHDIGKIGVRDEILTKPGRLTEEEFEHIKTHPEKSYLVLEPLDALREILGAVRHHHERFDGSGYPDHLAGEDIPLLARILQVADIWDALTSTRSYRAAMSREKAIKIMRTEAGTTMDPHLVDAFLKIIERQ